MLPYSLKLPLCYHVIDQLGIVVVPFVRSVSQSAVMNTILSKFESFIRTSTLSLGPDIFVDLCNGSRNFAELLELRSHRNLNRFERFENFFQRFSGCQSQFRMNHASIIRRFENQDADARNKIKTSKPSLKAISRKILHRQLRTTRINEFDVWREDNITGKSLYDLARASAQRKSLPSQRILLMANRRFACWRPSFRRGRCCKMSTKSQYLRILNISAKFYFDSKFATIDINNPRQIQL